jgi:mRNA interferase MazF
MEIALGDLVTIAVAGDYGKPRPALVVQANAFNSLASLTVLRVTNALHNFPSFRITLDPTRENGLQAQSQIMIDKAASVPRRRVGGRIGRVDPATLRRVDQALATFLGLD